MQNLDAQQYLNVAGLPHPRKQYAYVRKTEMSTQVGVVHSPRQCACQGHIQGGAMLKAVHPTEVALA